MRTMMMTAALALAAGVAGCASAPPEAMAQRREDARADVWREEIRILQDREDEAGARAGGE